MSGTVTYFEYGERELDHLRRKDKKLGAAIDRLGLIRREVSPDTFEALVDSVIGQQISAKAAATVSTRLRGLAEITPEGLHRLGAEQIKSCGMSARKASYICNIAEAAVTGAVDFASLAKADDGEVIRRLTAIKGVGLWTAEMLLIFSLQRPNVISYGDLAIRRGMMNLYGHKELGRDRFARYAARYSPYASTASLYLWELSVEL
ncbi:MAG: DNA-3-methyladenine glycosylase 2 family protein [Defluviitaleaceae bacterium]|nr:DNA-3-methyladenine glycosylase 2 family protein [Defluviitaleaceae bacterium]